MAGKQGRRRTEQQCQTVTTLNPLCTNEDFKQGPCFRVNSRLYRSQTLSPFQHSLQRGNYRHIRHGTKPTIHRDKRGLCAGEVTWKRSDKTPFMIPPGKRHPCGALPWKLRFQMIMVEPRGRLNPSPYNRIWIRYHHVYFNGRYTKSLICVKTESCAWNSTELCA